MFLKQCQFQNGNQMQTAWIEESAAKVGNLVSFEEDRKVFWKVRQVFGRLQEDLLKHRDKAMRELAWKLGKKQRGRDTE